MIVDAVDGSNDVGALACEAKAVVTTDGVAVALDWPGEVGASVDAVLCFDPPVIGASVLPVTSGVPFAPDGVDVAGEVPVEDPRVTRAAEATDEAAVVLAPDVDEPVDDPEAGPDDEGEPVSADATPLPVNTAAPTPSATANPPTRPM